MKKSPNLDYREEFEKQLMTDEELVKVKAKDFINLLSDLFLKYEPEIDRKIVKL